MARDDRVRLDIAFEGGVSLAVTVPRRDGRRPRPRARDAAADSFSFEAEDGRYTLSVRKIVFTKRSDREQVVGFGAIEATSG